MFTSNDAQQIVGREWREREVKGKGKRKKVKGKRNRAAASTQPFDGYDC